MPEDSSADFGSFLRQSRERTGVSLRQIAVNTKISVPALEALERNDVSRLPGGIFSRAFVRAYAREVGLDPEEAVRRFVACFPEASGEVPPPAYEVTSDETAVGHGPGLGWALRAIWWGVPLLLAVAYFGFGGRLPLWHETPPPVEREAEPRAEAQPSAPASAPAAAADASHGVPAATPSGQPGAQGAGSATPQQVATAQAQPPPAGGPQAPAARQGTQAPGPGAPSAPVEGGFRMTLAPRGDCWVSVKANGMVVYSGLMKTGERRDLVLRGNVSVTLGNAGVMGMTIDNQPVRQLGAVGQVVTTVVTAENLKTLLEPAR